MAAATADFYSLPLLTALPTSSHTGNLSASDTLPTGTTFQTTGSSSECAADLAVVPSTRSVTFAVFGTNVFTINVKVGADVSYGTILDNSASVSSRGTAEGGAT